MVGGEPVEQLQKVRKQKHMKESHKITNISAESGAWMSVPLNTSNAF